jgi:hypothetical protein
MSLDSWMTVKRGQFESAEAFAQPAFRCPQFRAATGLVVVLAVLDILLVIRLFNRITLMTIIFIALVLLMVLGNWFRVLVTHRRLHELYISANVGSEPTGSAIDTALRASSSLSYWSVVAPAATGMAGLAALIQIFRNH